MMINLPDFWSQNTLCVAIFSNGNAQMNASNSIINLVLFVWIALNILHENETPPCYKYMMAKDKRNIETWIGVHSYLNTVVSSKAHKWTTRIVAIFH